MPQQQTAGLPNGRCCMCTSLRSERHGKAHSHEDKEASGPLCTNFTVVGRPQWLTLSAPTPNFGALGQGRSSPGVPVFRGDIDIWGRHFNQNRQIGRLLRTASSF